MTTKRNLYGNLIVFVLLWVLLVLAASSKHLYIAAGALTGMLILVAYTYITERAKWIDSQTPVNLPHEMEMHQPESFFKCPVLEERRKDDTKPGLLGGAGYPFFE